MMDNNLLDYIFIISKDKIQNIITSTVADPGGAQVARAPPPPPLIVYNLDIISLYSKPN